MDEERAKRLADEDTARAAARAASDRQIQDNRERQSAIFDQQIDSLWDRLQREFNQFTDAYNKQKGSQHIFTEVYPDMITVTPTKGTESARVTLRLDRIRHDLSGMMSHPQGAERLHVGLTVDGNDLKLT
jgi:hypothetical protein